MADDEKVQTEQAVAVTGRPNDIPINDPQPAPLGGNSTFADRAKARKAQPATKQVDDDTASTEDKAVTSAQSKARRTTRK